MSKQLVAYFSASGVTAKVAKQLAQVIGADLFEIRPQQPYTEADLDWRDQGSRSSVEMKDAAARPAMAESTPDMAQYDTVFLGFPIWWYVAPTIIDTFLESYYFSGKTIVPFATSGGSGFGRTAEVLKPLCSDTAKWLPGKMLNRTSEKEMEEWVSSLS